ncbi:hypothetical protein M9Y10_018797 [Tritrichomonas musculus]|uniref:Kelch motif family protein n=1 Tax=Tritrichomonas musculus TaxID=1915356 RepID=A0ABR2HHQ8_9EUKA
MGNENSQQMVESSPSVDGVDSESRGFTKTKFVHMEDAGSFLDDEDFAPPEQPMDSIDAGGKSSKLDPSKLSVQKDLTKMPYNGYWCVKTSVGRNFPENRTDQFTAQLNSEIAYTGFGKSEKGKLLNDIWELNIKTNSWKQINTNQSIEPRFGASATMMGDLLVIYGGTNGSTIFNDLISVNVKDGVVSFIKTKGQQPPPLSFAPIAINKNQLFLFAGMDGLFILSLEKLQWRCISSYYRARQDFPWYNYKGVIYAIPEGEKSKFLIIDTNDERVYLSPEWSGSFPPIKDPHPLMVVVGKYLFFFGGERDSLIYACYLEMNWWFVFFVIPDTNTTSYAQGKFSSDGLFKIPILYSNSIVYNEKSREIVMFLGYPFGHLILVYYLKIGEEALPFCNLREDMTRALSSTY